MLPGRIWLIEKHRSSKYTAMRMRGDDLNTADGISQK